MSTLKLFKNLEQGRLDNTLESASLQQAVTGRILGLRKTGSRANATTEIYFSDTIPDTEIQAHSVHEEQRVPS